MVRKSGLAASNPAFFVKSFCGCRLPFSPGVEGNWSLKAEAQTGIYHTAFQQCPCIDRPFSVEVLLWPQQRIVTGLADIQQIFGIHENAGWTGSPLDEHAKYPVRHALGTIRIVFQALPARIKEFKTDAAFCFPLPSAHDAGGVLRCQRNGPPPAIVPIDFGL